jgi:hypothetical protein
MDKSEVCEYLTQGTSVLDRNITELVHYGENLTIKLVLRLSEYVDLADIKLTIFSMLGEVVAESYTKTTSKKLSLNRGVVSLTMDLGPLFLKQSSYMLSIVVLNRHNNEHIYWGSRIYKFRAEGPSLGSGSYIVPIDVDVSHLK